MGVRSRGEAGGAQFGLSVAGSVVRLIVPAEAAVAEIFVRTAAVNFTREGTDPTTTRGFTAYPDDIIILNSRSEIEQVEMLRATGTSATVDVEYFTDISG